MAATASSTCVIFILASSVSRVTGLATASLLSATFVSSTPSARIAFLKNVQGRYFFQYPRSYHGRLAQCQDQALSLSSREGRTRMSTTDGGDLSSKRVSVTGTIYSDNDDPDVPVVKLFTKQGCTLCDKVTEVLQSVREHQPHTLEAVDITDQEHFKWHSKYKYDIPVLHMNDKYWIKHRLTVASAIEGLDAARKGSFVEQDGDPDAEMFERRRGEA